VHLHVSRCRTKFFVWWVWKGAHCASEKVAFMPYINGDLRVSIFLVVVSTVAACLTSTWFFWRVGRWTRFIGPPWGTTTTSVVLIVPLVLFAWDQSSFLFFLRTSFWAFLFLFCSSHPDFCFPRDSSCPDRLFPERWRPSFPHQWAELANFRMSFFMLVWKPLSFFQPISLFWSVLMQQRWNLSLLLWTPHHK